MTKGLQTLSDKGNDVAIAIHRFRNNESTYVSYLHKFLVDPTYEQFKYCIEGADYDHAKSYCSALNGLASNLGLTKIAKASAQISYLLYAMDLTNLELFLANLDDAYNETIDLINQV